MPEIISLTHMQWIPSENQHIEDKYLLLCNRKWQHGITWDLVFAKPGEPVKNMNSQILQQTYGNKIPGIRDP